MYSKAKVLRSHTLCAVQWVFYLFGAAAVVWLPFWLPQRIAGGSGGGGSGGKGFNILALFSSSAASPSVPPSASVESFAEDGRQAPPQRVLSNAGGQQRRGPRSSLCP